MYLDLFDNLLEDLSVVQGIVLLCAFLSVMILLVIGLPRLETRKVNYEVSLSSENVESVGILDEKRGPRVIQPINSFDSDIIIRERDLYGTYLQEIGNIMLGLNFLTTEEFGPYTVIYVYGEESNEVVRMGTYEITEVGDLKLHLRFKENKGGDLMLDPQLEEWHVEVESPFIKLTDGKFTLLTTLDNQIQPDMGVYNE